MLSKKEKIRLVFGVIIFVLIFAIIFIYSRIENDSSQDSLFTYSEKYKKTLPANFSDEIFDINGMSFTNLLIKEDEKIICFSLSSKASESFNSIKERLENNHWKFAESGSQTAGSFYKNEGQIT